MLRLNQTVTLFGALLLGLFQSSNAQSLPTTGYGDKSAWPVFRGPDMNNSARAKKIFAPGRKYDFKVVWKRALARVSELAKPERRPSIKNIKIRQLFVVPNKNS